MKKNLKKDEELLKFFNKIHKDIFKINGIKNTIFLNNIIHIVFEKNDLLNYENQTFGKDIKEYCDNFLYMFGLFAKIEGNILKISLNKFN